LALLIAAASGQAAELAHRWSFNGDLTDSVGGRDAVIVNAGANDATLSETQVTLAGGGKDASDYIDLPDGIVSSLGDTVTFECWATQESVQNWSRIFDFGTSTTHNVFMSWTSATTLTADRVEWVGPNGTSTVNNSNAPYTLGVEYHIVCVFEPGRVTWYTAPANSPDLGPAKGTFQTNNVISGLADTNVWLGRSQWGDNTANASFNEARLWVGALTAEERENYHDMGPDVLNPTVAKGPSPVNQSIDIPRETNLSWVAGETAVAHDVYLGTTLADVENASRAASLGVLVSQGQPGTTYDPPAVLEFGQTYYWRIDEVDAANAIEKGFIWSFTVEPTTYLVADVNVTATIPPELGSDIRHVVDGAGLRDDGGHAITVESMWKGEGKPGDAVTVQFEFDRAYKLTEMRVWNYNHQYEPYLFFSLKDITVEYSTDAEEWAVLGDYVLPQGTGKATFKHMPIDFGGVAAKYVRFVVNSNYGGDGFGLSEVQFYQKPTFAREPQPAAGAVDVDPSVVLSWRAGREAVKHEVHIGMDSNTVAAGGALMDVVSVPSYDTTPLNLMMGEKYYWMINEVNEAEAIAAWSSDVWDFNTPDFVVIEDFESYDDEEGTRIFDIWLDGYQDNTNGSLVGNDNPPYAEQVNVRSGDQSMIYLYGENGITTSEATLTLSSAQDWTRAGAQTLVVWFRGSLGNPAAQLYVKVNGTRVDYDGSASSLAAPVWKQWNIDLGALGNAAKAAKTLVLGVSGSGTGTLYFDDIRLYRAAAPATGNAVDPGTANLAAYYPMSDNANDATANARHATAETGSSFGAGPLGYGRAIVLDGTSGHVTLPIGTLIQSSNSITVATWVNWTGTGGYSRLFDFGTGTTVNMWMAPNGYGGLVFAISTGGSGSESRLVAPTALPRGWRHVAVTIDGATSEMNLYLDGRVVDTETTATLPSALGNTTQNWIGRSQYTADPYFGGSFDEFRIYNRALTAGEVQYLAGDR
jgi:hypothetical protein